MNRFPKDCWGKNCPHFHTVDMSIDDLFCTCDILQEGCDACDEDFCFLICPLSKCPLEGYAGMKEYIEREAVLDAIKSVLFDQKCDCEVMPEVFKRVQEVEADDVAPVRHGRWIDAESDDGCTVWHCSKCSYPIKTICWYPIYKYCPMCGALMDGKEAVDGARWMGKLNFALTVVRSQAYRRKARRSDEKILENIRR